MNIAQQMIQENHPAVAITGVLILIGVLAIASIAGQLIRRRVFGVKTHHEVMHLEEEK